MKFDNPQNTVYITVVVHMSERWFSGSPIIQFGLHFW